MNARSRFACLALCLVAAGPFAAAGASRAADSSEGPVILVAKPALRDFLYGATILIAKPLDNGRHIGLIVNRPTRVTLGKLFPDHGPSQKVTDPLYLGGPVNTETIFALVQRGDNPGKRSVQIAPDLFLAHDREIVDRIIESEAGNARFFAGLVLWRPNELRTEIDRGFWYVLDADVELVLRKSTEGLWEELVKRSEMKARAI